MNRPTIRPQGEMAALSQAEVCTHALILQKYIEALEASLDLAAKMIKVADPRALVDVNGATFTASIRTDKNDVFGLQIAAYEPGGWYWEDADPADVSNWRPMGPRTT